MNEENESVKPADIQPDATRPGSALNDDGRAIRRGGSNLAGTDTYGNQKSNPNHRDPEISIDEGVQSLWQGNEVGSSALVPLLRAGFPGLVQKYEDTTGISLEKSLDVFVRMFNKRRGADAAKLPTMTFAEGDHFPRISTDSELIDNFVDHMTDITDVQDSGIFLPAFRVSDEEFDRAFDSAAYATVVVQQAARHFPGGIRGLQWFRLAMALQPDYFTLACKRGFRDADPNDLVALIPEYADELRLR